MLWKRYPQEHENENCSDIDLCHMGNHCLRYVGTYDHRATDLPCWNRRDRFRCLTGFMDRKRGKRMKTKRKVKKVSFTLFVLIQILTAIVTAVYLKFRQPEHMILFVFITLFSYTILNEELEA